MSQLGLVRHILTHPINRGRGLGALRDYLSWQVGSRLLPGPVAVPYVNDSVLITRRGMHGATLNIYCGLADFKDMGFLLHLLRPTDLFVDVGANVGSYTVLASRAVGARSVAFEPNPETFADLVANIAGNSMGDRVQACRAGVGLKPGVLRFEANGTQTRVVIESGRNARIFESPIVTLNNSFMDASPALIKIDVEGFENDVLAGADEVLRRPELLALILENSEECVEYGFASDQAHKQLLEYGFALAAYSPRKRKLTLMNTRTKEPNNLIYVRNLAEVKTRLDAASPFTVKGQQI